MAGKRKLRSLLVLGTVLAGFVALAALLYVAETAIQVWEHLRTAPMLLRGLMGLGLLAIAALTAWAVFRLLWPRTGAPASREPPADESGLRERLAEAEQGGVDVSEVRDELEQLDRRRAESRLQIALAGEINAGKSSLVKALLPGEEVQVNVLGGSTRQIRSYEWLGADGEALLITDLPGFGEAGGDLDQVAGEEALRAHAVVFLCEGDLTRADYLELQRLRELGKPVIVALNKSDRLDETDRTRILDHIGQQLRSLPGGEGVPVVSVVTGGTEEVQRLLPDGGREVVDRPRPAEVEELRRTLFEVLSVDDEGLQRMREGALLALAGMKLDRAEAAYRGLKSERLVGSYTRKAVVGALAALSPGTDVLIQGYLGTQMVRELCNLYGVPARDLDIQAFLDLSQSHVGKTVPIVMAIAGNGLKAFPGIGTVAGGLVHAVAYGLIFDALGRSLVSALEAGKGLEPRSAAEQFREQLSENLEARTRHLIELALDAGREQDS